MKNSVQLLIWQICVHWLQLHKREISFFSTSQHFSYKWLRQCGSEHQWNKLHDTGVNGTMFYWIKDFFNNRSTRVRVGGDYSGTTYIENSTPQDLVISPVLFDDTSMTHFKIFPIALLNCFLQMMVSYWTKRGRRIKKKKKKNNNKQQQQQHHQWKSCTWPLNVPVRNDIMCSPGLPVTARFTTSDVVPWTSI